jgi:KaiC/GvpD/RAD55 family RecA-like ATPase
MSDYDDEFFDEPIERDDYDDDFGDEPISRDDEFTQVPDDDGGDYENEKIVDVTQHMLLSYLNANHELWIRCSPILQSEYFTPDLMAAVDMIREFEITNQQLPNNIMVHADTGVSLVIPEDANDAVVVENVAIRVEEFCRHKAAATFLEESYDILQEDKTKSTMSFLVSEMDRISKISVQQDMGYEVHDDVLELLQIAEDSDALPTDFFLLDHALNGGVTNPSYNLVSAASGQGKSIMLQNLSINYIRQGHNVVYISLELPEFMVEKRFVAMMTDTNINQIYRNIDSVVTQMKRARHKEGKLRIKRMSMTGTSLADIRAYVAELVSTMGGEWNHIMIDYPDLMIPMRPDIRADNIHLKDQAISEEIFEWTHEKNSTKTIWGASQQVKGAKDEKDARQSGVSGGVGKVHTCDNLVILKRSKEDIQDGRCWGFIEKGRNGGTGMRIPFKWDINTQRMTASEDMMDLYEEANTPSSDHKSPEKTRRFVEDPMRKANDLSKTSGARKASATARMMKEKLNAGKKAK